MSTRSWDNSTYPGTELANTIDDQARNMRVDVWDTLVQGGHKLTGVGGGSHTPPAGGILSLNDGKHCVGWETQTHQDNTGHLTLAWSFDGATPLVRQYGSGSVETALNGRTIVAGESPCEFVGSRLIGPAAGFWFEGIAYAALVRAIAFDALPSANSYLKRVLYKCPYTTGSISRTLDRAMVIVGTQPVGADLVVGIYKIPNATAIPAFNRFDPVPPVAPNHVLLSTIILTTLSGSYSIENTSVAGAIAPGDEIVAYYTTTGNATDVSILLQLI